MRKIKKNIDYVRIICSLEASASATIKQCMKTIMSHPYGAKMGSVNLAPLEHIIIHTGNSEDSLEIEVNVPGRTARMVIDTISTRNIKSPTSIPVCVIVLSTNSNP